MVPALHCTLDIEASGFGHAGYPIEVGYVCDDGSAWCTLVRPEPEWTHWDDGAEQVHGITRALLVAHGRSARAVAQRLNDDLAGRVLYSDGWMHDYIWLAKLFDASGLSPRFKLASVRELLDEGRLARLDGLRQSAFGVLGVNRHRASADARALQWALAQAAQPPAPHA